MEREYPKSLCPCGCQVKGSQYFCPTCFHNFNPEDCFYDHPYDHPCPKCYPKKELKDEG